MVVAILLLAVPGAAFEASFHLVPERHYEEPGERTTHQLEAGTVYLYREGAYEPELVFPVNHLERIPAGTWYWIAEGHEHVTVGTGTLVVEDEHRDATRRIVWPVVPACEIALEQGRGWRGVHRLDLVSLDHGSVYPVDPTKRETVRIPAGPAMAYSVGTRGLIGIRSVKVCQPGERLVLPAPASPAQSEQDLLVRARVPEGLPDKALEKVRVVARPRQPSSTGDVVPDAVVWSGRRMTAFFLSLPAEQDLELVLEGPELRTVVKPVEALGGSARELPLLTMNRLRDLTVRVDYQPVEPHEPARLEIERCGRSESARRLGSEPCVALDRELSLRPGLHTYTFEDLDDGLYVIGARIGDEVIHHLGPGFSLFLDPAAEDPPPPPQASLIEMEIWGHLLAGDEPVPGEVRLVPTTAQWPLRRFPTDEDLTYRLTYFGRPPLYEDPELEGREPDEVLGLYFFYRLSVCNAQRVCDVYGQYSSIRGSGRLDLQVPASRGLEITVLDDGDGSPISGAEVLYWDDGEEIHFDRGEVELTQGKSAPTASLTGPDGVARIGDLPAGSFRVGVKRDGYRPARGVEAIVPDDGFAQRTVRLTRKGSAESSPDTPAEPGLALSFPSGVPVAGAVLLALDGDGAMTACRTTTDADGVARFRAGCPGDGHVVVLHPHTRITLFDAARVRSASELEVPGAPPRPLLLRLVDEEGAPMANRWLELRYPEVTLSPTALLMLRNHSGAFLLTATDEAGVALLRGVDPRAATVPEVAPAGHPEHEGVPLSGHQPGDTVEIVLPRGR